MEKHNKSCKVSRVEDNHHMLHVRTICLHVLSELLSNLAVAFEKVFACHSLLTWSSTGRDDVLGIGESLFRVSCPCEVHTFEAAMEHFLCNSLETWLIHIIETDVRSKFHHHGSLGHV